MTLSGYGLTAPPLGNSPAIYNIRIPFVLRTAMALLGSAVLLFAKKKKPVVSEK
jgi:hypothetical protein